MVTKKQKPRTDALNINIGKTEYTTIENHRFTKVDINREKNKQCK